MGQINKRLGAVSGSGTIGTPGTLYTASATANSSTVISSIVVCNAGATARLFRICISATASFDAPGYLAYEATIAPYDTIALTLGVVLDPTNDNLLVSSDHADVKFSAFGVEITP